MTTQQIRFFLEAAECLNFTEAAKRLFVAQSTLSKQIALLEDELGLKLFYRSNRTVGLTPAAMKAAAGALEWIKVARVTNLTRALETLKAQNVWTYATDMDGEDYRRVNFSGGCALVIGAEGQGVSRLVRETCDQVVSIPMKGHIDSLNASVAAGVILAEIARQRG